jgi:ATP-dependent DNA helicase PIF1
MHPSTDQQLAIEAALAGKSFFLTGSAGTGKSFTLQKVIEAVRNKYTGRPGAVGIVAPTGAAALQVGGTTIHNYFGFKAINQQQSLKHYEWKRQSWTQLHVLIIDEISMVADWMLNFLDRMARESRSTSQHLPFGNIQLILSGDFLQLAPIDGTYCFKSKAWKETMSMCIELKYPYRQGNDQDFASILGRVRMGNVDQALLDTLTKGGENKSSGDGIEQTRLYSKRVNVEQENTSMTKLKQLPGEAHVFSAQDQGPAWALEEKKLSNWSNTPSNLSLKIGAQVVLLKNLDIQQGLVNGSRGIVVGFSPNGAAPVVRFLTAELTMTVEIAKWTLNRTENNAVIATRLQYPLDLAWAIHKSQGMSLDAVYTDLSECFAEGMAYVALSRCKTLRGLTVAKLNAKSIRANKEAIEFHANIGQAKGGEEERAVKRHKVCLVGESEESL